MMELKESSVRKVNSNIIGEYNFYYDLYSNNAIIGEAAIATNSHNMIYIYIFEKNRGNNLGKEAFDILMQKFKELNINKASIMISNDNIRMIRILNHKKFKIISSGANFKCYEVTQ